MSYHERSKSCTSRLLFILINSPCLEAVSSLNLATRHSVVTLFFFFYLACSRVTARSRGLWTKGARHLALCPLLCYIMRHLFVTQWCRTAIHVENKWQASIIMTQSQSQRNGDGFWVVKSPTTGLSPFTTTLIMNSYYFISPVRRGTQQIIRKFWEYASCEVS